MTAKSERSVLVVGTGPAGLAAALALAKAGAAVTAAGPLPDAEELALRDTRTAALLESSIELLKDLGVWEMCAAQAAPLRAIRIVDATASLFRAPEVEFEAREIGLDAFGYNIANAHLVAALAARASETSGLALIQTQKVNRLEIGGNCIAAMTEEGSRLEATLVVGADGRHSMCRDCAGIETRAWTYPQAAIACSFTHSLPHDNVSNELHYEAGPLTTVPLPSPTASSLVWVEMRGEAERLMRLDAGEFAGLLEERLHGILGGIGAVTHRACFPLGALIAKRLAARRVALVGEAAHLLPPIGAQGLNLGFRDAAALAACVGDALQRNGDPGSETVLEAYASARQADVTTRVLAVDLLNRSLLTGFLPLQLARGAVLHGLAAIGPLRRLAMRLGMGPLPGFSSLLSGTQP